MPPDLGVCTRLEIHYRRGAIDYFFPDSYMQEGVLSEKEKECVRSYDTFMVTDREQIQRFARHISRGTYQGEEYGTTEIQATITGYRGSHRETLFTVHGMRIITEDKHEFTYPPGFLILASLDPPQLGPLRARWECGVNLSSLIYHGLWIRRRSPRPHLDPTHWCDTIAERFRSRYIIHEDQENRKDRMFPDATIARRFSCPSLRAPVDEDGDHPWSGEGIVSGETRGTWTSDYAMNPNCRADSPADVVLLFESERGWNQHGGPELFTFDNHDPKGGLVLLNDGTVKFIRTDEELNQLRWYLFSELTGRRNRPPLCYSILPPHSKSTNLS